MEKNKYIILDGAMGTMLNLEPGQRGEFLNIEDPARVIGIHKAYIEAGSQVIYTNTFGVSPIKMEDSNYSTEELIVAGIENAKGARGDSPVKIALSLGSIGQMMEPMGSLSFDMAYDQFKYQALLGSREGVDLIVLETITDLSELRAAILAVKENTSLPLFVTMSFEKNGRTFSGCLPESFALTATGLGVDALGVNCSLGPFEILPIIEKISKFTDLPLIVKANAGLPTIEGDYTMGREEFSVGMEGILDLGVTYLGGCCGTDPSYIQRLAQLAQDRPCPSRKSVLSPAICSPSFYLPLEGFIPIGERINPTGRADLRESLSKGETRAVVKEALLQSQGPCQVLDINLGAPGLEEEVMMPRAIRDIQSLVDLPLQIDSGKVAVIEAGLRAYNGKAIINSVTGERDKLEAILPLAKKYGAALIGLCLDEEGIPMTPQGRLKIAEKIQRKAQEYGIPQGDIIIDPLALTLSSHPDSALVALDAIGLIKKNLSLKTILGISNISFGLPAREEINASFLMMARARGLDMAIINPLSPLMTQALGLGNLVLGLDQGAKDFIQNFRGNPGPKEESQDQDQALSLDYALAKGLDQDLLEMVEELLKEKTELEIIDQDLIPALDKLGAQFEAGKIFLPQLIRGASTASLAFDLLKDSIESKGLASLSKGDIVLATVKGDIHDIGKNIARVIMENYGYRVYDLGKDVPVERILKIAKEKGVKLFGLSALMTTSLEAMEETIRALKAQDSSIQVMVGGAVLTEGYAKAIGADYYLEDAKDNIRVARLVLG